MRQVLKVYSKEQESFPRKLEDRIETILASVNSEIKQLILIFLGNNFVNSYDLIKEFKDVIKPKWIPSNSSIRENLEYLFSNGLTEQGEVEFEGKAIIVPAYRTSKANEKYGKAIAAFSLMYAVNTGTSMYTYFGQTSSSGETRSGFNRFRLLKLIYNGAKTEAELGEKTGLAQDSIRQPLKIFHDLGLIIYRSLDIRERAESYSLNPKYKGKPQNVMPLGRLTKLTRLVAEKSYELGENFGNFGIDDIMDALGGKYSRMTVGRVLLHLAKQGLLKNPYPTTSFSYIKMTKKGRKFVEDYLLPLENALKGGKELEDMQKQYEFLMSNSRRALNYINQAIELYRSASPRFRGKKLQERLQQTLRIINSNPGIRPRDLEKELGTKPYYFLKILSEEGKIEAVREGSATMYFVIK